MILTSQTGILLRVILILAILLRIVGLWQEVSTQETENIRLALLPLLEISREVVNEGHGPPLYPFLLSAFNLISDQVEWLRLSSVLAGVFLVLWMFRLGSYWGNSLGNLSAFIIAVSPPFIKLSISLTPGIWSCLFSAMALYYFWRWLQTRRAEALFIYEVCLLLLLYTSNIGIAWFVAFNALFLATALFHPAFYEVFRKHWWVNQVLLSFFYLPWLLHLPGPSGQVEPADPIPLTLMLTGLALLVPFTVHHLQAARTIESRPEAMRHVSLVILTPVICLSGMYTPGLVSAGIPLTLLVGWSIIQVAPKKEEFKAF